MQISNSKNSSSHDIPRAAYHVVINRPTENSQGCSQNKSYFTWLRRKNTTEDGTKAYIKIIDKPPPEFCSRRAS